MILEVDDVHFNDLMVKSFKRFLELTKNGAKTIDIKVRKDARETSFEADWMKHIRIVKDANL